MHRAALPAALLAALLLGGPALAAPVRTPHVEAELVAERTSVAPGETLTVALRLKMIPEWHTYWRNPGDSGEPTRLEWRLPPGFEASEIYWPYPQRLPAGPLMNYGYEGEVLLLSRITPPRELASGTPVTFAAKASWLVCSREHCIPEDGEVSLTLPSNARWRTRWAKLIAAARAASPAAGGLSGWTLAARGEAGGHAHLVLPADARCASSSSSRSSRRSSWPTAAVRARTTRYRSARGRDAAGRRVRAARRRTRVAGRPGCATGARAVTIDADRRRVVTLGTAPLAGTPAASVGLLLALVRVRGRPRSSTSWPCVLPVLLILVLGFAGKRRRRPHAGATLVYAAGVLAVLAAAALLGARARSELGWGLPAAVAGGGSLRSRSSSSCSRSTCRASRDRRTAARPARGMARAPARARLGLRSVLRSDRRFAVHGAAWRRASLTCRRRVGWRACGLHRTRSRRRCPTSSSRFRSAQAGGARPWMVRQTALAVPALRHCRSGLPCVSAAKGGSTR
jgi:thiol:disulfide interchange protein DsbD